MRQLLILKLQLLLGHACLLNIPPLFSSHSVSVPFFSDFSSFSSFSLHCLCHFFCLFTISATALLFRLCCFCFSLSLSPLFLWNLFSLPSSHTQPSLAAASSIGSLFAANGLLVCYVQHHKLHQEPKRPTSSQCQPISTICHGLASSAASRAAGLVFSTVRVNDGWYRIMAMLIL